MQETTVELAHRLEDGARQLATAAEQDTGPAATGDLLESLDRTLGHLATAATAVARAITQPVALDADEPPRHGPSSKHRRAGARTQSTAILIQAARAELGDAQDELTHTPRPRLRHDR